MYFIYFEIVSKGPIAKHLKECVMVNILPHVIQIIVLSSSSYALLGISGSDKVSQIAVWVCRSQKYRLELKARQYINILNLKIDDIFQI
jgi:hypothetical protein